MPKATASGITGLSIHISCVRIPPTSFSTFPTAVFICASLKAAPTDLFNICTSIFTALWCWSNLFSPGILSPAPVSFFSSKDTLSGSVITALGLNNKLLLTNTYSGSTETPTKGMSDLIWLPVEKSEMSLITRSSWSKDCVFTMLLFSSSTK